MADGEKELCDSFYFLSNGKRKFMRVFITFERERVPMDIPMGINVGKTKALIVKKMSIPQSNIQLGAENQLKKVLVLNFAGAELPDHWILSDLGISPGSTLKAYMKEEMDPILYFRIGYNQDTIPILEKMKLPELSVADLRSLASKKSGLPCSVFRLVTENGKDMFDCYMVEDYGIRLNSIVKIETWDGWNEFLHLCSLGFTHHVLEKINADDDILARYQMKVAMFMAAHFGHVDLAVTMCRQGIKPGEPVGLHPLRQWCPNNQHIENLKAPIHEAVEFGQLSVLRAFVHHNITSILCKDGAGLQPLNIALRKKMKSCASFLLTKQWSRIPFNGNTITLSIFSKLKKWTERAKEKASMNYNPDKPGIRRKIIRSFPLIGQGIYIDGYSADQISSRSKFPSKKTNKQTHSDSYYQDLYGFNPEQYFKSLNVSTIKAPKNRSSNRSGYRRHNKLSSAADMSSSDVESQIGTPDVFSKEKQFKLPKINAESIKPTEMKSRASSSQSIDGLPQENQANLQQKVKKKKKHPHLSEHNVKLNKTKVESNFPLPLKSIDHTPRPYYYVGPRQIDDIAKSIEIYYKDRGYLPREYAIKCLSLTNQLKDKSWLSQVRIAMKLGKESVKKSLDSYTDSILSQ